MNLSRPHHRMMVAALCLLLVGVRLSGVHLHLCFDGSEPPLSYHVADSGVHHQDELGAEEPHSDVDLVVGSDLMVKKPQQGLEAPILPFVLALLLLVFSRSRHGRPADPSAGGAGPCLPWLRPPLRGPPSPA